MINIIDGGHVFSRPEAWATDGSGSEKAQDGISLRDLFAGMSMMGMILAGTEVEEVPGHFSHTDGITEMAYKYADAMLVARKAGAA